MALPSILLSLKAVALLLGAMVATAFFTLLEHKLLGLSQSRKGPNKVGPMGLLQPFADAVKLLAKSLFFPAASNPPGMLAGSILALFASLLAWATLPSAFGLLNISMPVLLLLSCMSVSSCAGFLMGWASYSKYSLLGSLRTVAQTISYEAVLGTLLVAVLLPLGAVSWSSLALDLPLSSPLLLSFVGVWGCVCLAETNRTPFDFSEGESELVSGFNTEFSSSMFVLIFLAEYASILFLSSVSVVLFVSVCSPLLVCSLAAAVSAGFVWVRSTFPRLRYDRLMLLAWASLLPVSLNMGALALGYKVLC